MAKPIKLKKEQPTKVAKIPTKTYVLKGTYANMKKGDKVVLGERGAAFYKSLNLI